MVKIHALLLLALTSNCFAEPGSANELLNKFPDQTLCTPTQIKKIFDPKDIDECIRECPRTREYDPICGSDGVKYLNSGHLRCAQYCGVDVQPTHPPPCSPMTSTTERWNIDQCILDCPKTSEYNPMCGSDGKQYFNMGEIKCAQLCGLDVTFTHPAPCRPRYR